MNKLTATVSAFLILACTALAADYIDRAGNWQPQLPPRIVTVDGNVVSPVTLDAFTANGGRVATEEDYAERDARQAEVDAIAADFDFPPPEVIVPVLDANGERTGTARLLVDADGQIVVVTDTASPQRTAAVQIAEFKAKRAAAAAKLAKAKAEANGQLQKRIENIESVLGIRE